MAFNKILFALVLWLFFGLVSKAQQTLESAGTTLNLQNEAGKQATDRPSNIVSFASTSSRTHRYVGGNASVPLAISANSNFYLELDKRSTAKNVENTSRSASELQSGASSSKYRSKHARQEIGLPTDIGKAYGDPDSYQSIGDGIYLMNNAKEDSDFRDSLQATAAQKMSSLKTNLPDTQSSINAIIGDLTKQDNVLLEENQHANEKFLSGLVSNPVTENIDDVTPSEVGLINRIEDQLKYDDKATHQKFRIEDKVAQPADDSVQAFSRKGIDSFSKIVASSDKQFIKENPYAIDPATRAVPAAFKKDVTGLRRDAGQSQPSNLDAEMKQVLKKVMESEEIIKSYGGDNGASALSADDIAGPTFDSFDRTKAIITLAANEDAEIMVGGSRINNSTSSKKRKPRKRHHAHKLKDSPHSLKKISRGNNSSVLGEHLLAFDAKKPEREKSISTSKISTKLLNNQKHDTSFFMAESATPSSEIPAEEDLADISHMKHISKAAQRKYAITSDLHVNKCMTVNESKALGNTAIDTNSTLVTPDDLDGTAISPPTSKEKPTIKGSDLRIDLSKSAKNQDPQPQSSRFTGNEKEKSVRGLLRLLQDPHVVGNKHKLGSVWGKSSKLVNATKRILSDHKKPGVEIDLYITNANPDSHVAHHVPHSQRNNIRKALSGTGDPTIDEIGSIFSNELEPSVDFSHHPRRVMFTAQSDSDAEIESPDVGPIRLNGGDFKVASTDKLTEGKPVQEASILDAFQDGDLKKALQESDIKGLEQIKGQLDMQDAKNAVEFFKGEGSTNYLDDTHPSVEKLSEQLRLAEYDFKSADSSDGEASQKVKIVLHIPQRLDQDDSLGIAHSGIKKIEQATNMTDNEGEPTSELSTAIFPSKSDNGTNRLVLDANRLVDVSLLKKIISANKPNVEHQARQELNGDYEGGRFRVNVSASQARNGNEFAKEAFRNEHPVEDEDKASDLVDTLTRSAEEKSLPSTLMLPDPGEENSDEEKHYLNSSSLKNHLSNSPTKPIYALSRSTQHLERTAKILNFSTSDKPSQSSKKPSAIEEQHVQVGKSQLRINGGKVFGGSVVGGSILGGTVYGGDVEGGEILGGKIYGGQMLDGLLENGVIRNGTIKGGKIRGGEILGGELDSGLIDGGTVYGGRIEGGHLLNGSIKGGEFKGGEIQGGELVSGEMDGGLLKSGIIDGGILKGGVIDGGKLLGGVMLSGQLKGGVVRSGIINGGIIDSGVIESGEIGPGVEVNGGVFRGGKIISRLPPAQSTDPIDVLVVTPPQTADGNGRSRVMFENVSPDLKQSGSIHSKLKSETNRSSENNLTTTDYLESNFLSRKYYKSVASERKDIPAKSKPALQNFFANNGINSKWANPTFTPPKNFNHVASDDLNAVKRLLWQLEGTASERELSRGHDPAPYDSSPGAHTTGTAMITTTTVAPQTTLSPEVRKYYEDQNKMRNPPETEEWPIAHWALNSETKGKIPGSPGNHLQIVGGVNIRNGVAVLNGKDGYLDAGDYQGECVSDPEVCNMGFTIQMTLKVYRDAVFNSSRMYIFDSGAVAPDSRGFSLWVQDGRIGGAVALRNEYFCVRKILEPFIEKWMTIIFTWRRDKGLFLYINCHLFDNSLMHDKECENCAHCHKTDVATRLFFGRPNKGPHFHPTHMSAGDITMWEMNFDNERIKSMCGSNNDKSDPTPLYPYLSNAHIKPPKILADVSPGVSRSPFENNPLTELLAATGRYVKSREAVDRKSSPLLDSNAWPTPSGLSLSQKSRSYGYLGITANKKHQWPPPSGFPQPYTPASNDKSKLIWDINGDRRSLWRQNHLKGRHIRHETQTMPFNVDPNDLDGSKKSQVPYNEGDEKSIEILEQAFAAL